jgi:hypothetical protein
MYLGLFEARIDTRLKISQVREDTLLELFDVLDRATKGGKAEDQGADDVGTGNVIQSFPQYAGHELAAR